MTLLFTQEELIQYLYNETSKEKADEIRAAIQEDWTLREKLEVLKNSTLILNQIIESPRNEAVLHVLHYARETSAESIQQP